MRSEWRCLACDLELDEYSRPHIPLVHEPEHRIHLRIVGNWANYEDMPRSLRSVSKDICWGTVVNTPKYNKPNK